MLQQLMPEPGAERPGAAPAAARVSPDLVRRLRAEADADLLLPEPDCWTEGAAEIDGEHFGRHALAAYTSLRVLRLGCVLSALQRGTERKVVWHFGPSSGALVRGLRIVQPSCVQVVSGKADCLAAMAERLRRALPDCRLLTTNGEEELGDGAWTSFDIILLPEAMPRKVRPPRLDLAISPLALQRATPETARAYLRRAHDLGCLFLFSLSARGNGAGATDSAMPLIAEFYWPHPMPIKSDFGALRLEHSVLTPLSGEAEHAGLAKDVQPELIVGWRKIVP